MFDLSEVSDEELCDRVVAGKLAVRRATAMYLRDLAELKARGVCAQDRVTTATWLGWETNEGLGPARREVAAAMKFRTHFGPVLDALHDGEISVDHALTITQAANPRIMDEFSIIQKQLLDDATDMRYEPWKRRVRWLADQLDQDGGHDPNRDGRIGLQVRENFDGTFNLHGTLTAEDGLVFKTELARLADQFFANHKTDTKDLGEDHPNPLPGRAWFNAQAATEMARRSAARDGTDSKPPRPEVIVVWDLATGTPTTADGSPMRPATFHKLVPDAMWRAMWTDEGVPLNLGRTRRLASDAQRRALAIRDGGCIMDGCERPASDCRAHHAIAWDDDGETDLANLYLLCPTHHGLIHSQGWTTTTNPDHTLTWTTPTGKVIHSKRHPRHTDLP